ncbi:MAG: hypothetical protein ACFCD0_07390 [Gemmataceae bacterium]
MKYNRTSLIAVTAVTLLAVFASDSFGQYRYRNRRPYGGAYGPNVYAPYAGRGGAYAGQAELVRAAGDLQLTNEEVRQQREVTKRERMETQRQALDQRLYEIKNTPTYVDMKERKESIQLRRLLLFPQRGEITNGDALNGLMPYMTQLVEQGTQTPPIPLDPTTLDKINVMLPETQGNIGALRELENLEWPLVLRNEKQQEVDQAIKSTISATANGTVTFQQLKATEKQVTALREDLRLMLKNEEVDPGNWVTGNRFLKQLESGLQALGQPSSRKILTGSVKAEGRNVEELVYNMNRKGLKFAKATIGNESAYFELHSAFQAFAKGAPQSANSELSFYPAASYSTRTGKK